MIFLFKKQMTADILFKILSLMLILSAVFQITTIHPLRALLCLILCFLFLTYSLVIILECEFSATFSVLSNLLNYFIYIQLLMPIVLGALAGIILLLRLSYNTKERLMIKIFLTLFFRYYH